MHYLLSFILAMVVTMAGLPLLVRLAGRWNIIDLPGARKVHTTPIPRVGGLAMACGVAAAALLTMHLEGPDRWFLFAADVLVAFGAWDDWADLDYRIKLAGQLLAICIVVVLGDVQIRTITLDDSILLPDWISVPLTIFFLVGITNAINLADGLDGLAGGTTFFCLCAVALLSSIGETGTSTALALAFAGAVLGFLRFNTYPASVFMGDAGSQLLGFAIGVLSIRATQEGTSQISAAIPLLLLALPILDTLNVMTQRIGEGRSPFSADKNHIHHKLLALGFDHHEAVMVIYAIQGALFVAAYLLRFESDLLILGIITAFFAVSIGIFQIALRTGWKFRVKPPVGTPAAQFVDALQQPRLLPRLTKVAIAAALAGYAILIVAETSALSGDLRILIAALLAAIVGFLIIMRAAPLGVVEKSVLFVTATVLVYLEAVVLHPGRLMSTLGWGAVSVAALATAFRLRLLNDRRFQVTPLDLIVLFMALVVPSLPGTLHLPQGGALAIAKLIIVFYAIEMLVSRTDDRAVWVRIATASVLAGLTLRSLAIF
jgi:UDP-GlcNAc:undecaprenyl-phosphate/decaprenyl-phosphate GlcNAc-1-phosphate transferase